MNYQFSEIEARWKQYWKEHHTYKVENNSPKPTCYVLDMFPYPSGAGLHVGHPLGYIASDIYARYKRLKGFNVLHPMGFDAFGLPAEQYAIETGQHPSVTTEQNIKRYKEQLDNISFSYDWSREVKTSDPNYYRWTQWIFLQLYNSWYNPKTNKAEPIDTLKQQWDAAGKTYDSQDLMAYRLAYRAESFVNWCEALGTVLANDEVVNGVSERGGHPVERKKMSQWFLRITAFADRLLEGLDRVDFPESLKEMQRNWIGRSEGAEILFSIQQSTNHINVFTTRPDTIYGVSFMVLAPEHALVQEITTPEQKAAVADYQHYVSARSERERLAETKSITGCFTGAYAIHPFTQQPIPIWISEYVLAGYGTGAIMAVPCGDDRDYAFAKHFNLPIPLIFDGVDISEQACSDKTVRIAHSDFLTGLTAKDAIAKALDVLEEKHLGVRKINYRLRDAGFSRQRYWGEPFPVLYDEAGQVSVLDENELPLELPHLATYGPGPEGKGPLANAQDWVTVQKGGATYYRETDTMPGYAGSSWYYLRYMNPDNQDAFCSREASDYWNQVDVYVGGAEHAVGHLLYSRMWCKALYDLGYIGFDEPYKKLINQGMIQGSSRFAYQLNWFLVLGNDTFDYSKLPSVFISKNLGDGIQENSKESIDTVCKVINQYLEVNQFDVPYFQDQLFVSQIHVDVNIVDGHVMNVEEFKRWRPGYKNSLFIKEQTLKSIETGSDEDMIFLCSDAVEKMSKSKYNVVNPDDIITQYGADTFRMYEMFLGPLEMSKPWDTKGIEGVYRFLKKFWRLFMDEQQGLFVTNEKANAEELKVLHKHIKKIAFDIEHFAFNTSVSQFMIVTNELGAIKCNKREILEPLLITLAPFAPHISEELYHALGNTESITQAPFPEVNEAYLVENSFLYPIAIQGKTRTEMEFDLNASEQDIQEQVLANDIVQRWMEGKPLKKFIVVHKRMINVVVGA